MSNDHEYVFKLMWRATHKMVKMEASNPEQARKRIERMLMKEEGGVYCLEIQYVRQIR